MATLDVTACLFLRLGFQTKRMALLRVFIWLFRSIASYRTLLQHESAIPIVLHVAGTAVWSTGESQSTFPHSQAHVHIVNILAVVLLVSQAILSLNIFVITCCSSLLAKYNNLWVIPSPAFSKQNLNPVFTFTDNDVADSIPGILLYCSVDFEISIDCFILNKQTATKSHV